MLGRAQYFLFLLIVFFISSQVGYHFWPQFSYVNGVRVDYLSPILYLLDILIVGWIGVSLWMHHPHPSPLPLREREIDKATGSSITFRRGRVILIALLILDLVWNVFAARSVGAHLFGLVKLVEFGLFGILVAWKFRQDWISGLVRALSLSAILSSVLAIWQFLAKGSIGALWYFLGERTFSTSTIGISTVNLDQQILRPYAAFAHPNLLAFFLFISVVFCSNRLKFESAFWKYILILSTFLSVIGIVLSFSRISILLVVCFFFYEIYSKLKAKYRYFGLGFFQILIPFLAVFAYANYSTFLLRGIDLRQELLIQAFEIFKKSPYFGIGLNNFFVWQEPLIKTISPINLQPPHNIFLVALLSLGLFGFFIFPVLLISAFKSLLGKIRTTNNLPAMLRIARRAGEQQSFYMSVLLVLVGIIIVGMFDHFFLTLEQGQVMLALILGLAFSNISFPNTSKKRQGKGGK